MNLRKWMAALTVAASLGMLWQVSEAEARGRDRGLEIALGVGGSGCTDLYCAGFDMSAQTRLQVLFRVVRYFSVGAHIAFQFQEPDRNAPRRYDLGWSMLIGPEIRGILPVGKLEAWLGFTMGYMRIQIDQENDDNNEIDVAWANGFGFGFGFGAQYFVHRLVALGLDFWVYKGFFDEACSYENDDNPTVESCVELDRYDDAGIGVVFTFGVNLTFFISM